IARLMRTPASIYRWSSALSLTPHHASSDVMRIAALYDIHGNLPALEAVLREVLAARVDLVVVGGDVMRGPMARDVLDTLLNLGLPARFILGNGDREVLAARAGRVSDRIPE